MIFLHLLDLWLNKINILRMDPEIWECIIFGSKIVHLPSTRIFFTKTINMIFMFLLPLGLYSCEKILKKSLEQIQSYVDMSVLGLNLPIWRNKTFFEKTLFSCTYWPLWLSEILKKSLEWSKSYKDKWFLGPNWPRNCFGICWLILMDLLSYWKWNP